MSFSEINSLLGNEREMLSNHTFAFERLSIHTPKGYELVRNPFLGYGVVNRPILLEGAMMLMRTSPLSPKKPVQESTWLERIGLIVGWC